MHIRESSSQTSKETACSADNDDIVRDDKCIVDREHEQPDDVDSSDTSGSDSEYTLQDSFLLRMTQK